MTVQLDGGRGEDHHDADQTKPMGRVLLVDGDPVRAGVFCKALRETGAFEPVHVRAVVGAIREVTSRPFSLIATDTTVQRGRDGLKLVHLLLVEGAVSKPPSVLVITAETDPAVVQQCLRAGVADYVLYPCDPQSLLDRVRRAAGRSQSLGERLVLVATPYLGPAARVFLQQQVRAHLAGIALDTLKPEHLPVLFGGVRRAGARVLGKRIEELVGQLEAAFRTNGSPAPTN